MLGTNTTEENFSFQLLDYEIEHQGEAVIDLSVDWNLKEGVGVDDPFEYPDFTPIRDFITGFLVNYPNETDFWEILNKNLVTTLLTEPIPTPFGVEYNLDEVLDSITVDIDVQPGSSGIETPRSSMVVGTPEADAVALDETFSFQLLDYEVEHQGEAVIDLSVDLDLKEGIGVDDPFEYPDFIPIRDFITDFLVNYPNETDFWEILNKNLATALLTEPIPTPFGVEYNLNEVLDAITVDIDVQPGSSGIDTPRSSRIVKTVGNNQSQTTGDDDILFGGSNDRITAGSGNDSLSLDSGESNNILTGTKGVRDEFWLVTNTLDLSTQENTITGFEIGEDVIGFANTIIGFDDLNLISDGSNTIINAFGQDLAVLLNTQATDLSASDFVFA